MQKPKLPEKWRCDECGEIHDYEDEAYECCPPQVSRVFVCPVCDDHHMKEVDAIECCDYDPDSPPPQPTADELERAGQMRLVP